MTISYVEADARDVLEMCGLAVDAEFLAALVAQPHEKIVFGGVRAGKSTELAAEFMVDLPLVMARNRAAGTETLYWLVAPNYTLGHEEMSYLNSWCSKLGIVQTFEWPKQGPWLLKLANGITIATKSAEEAATLASVAPDRIGVCEAGQVSSEAREQVRLRALEKNARIIYTGTLEDDEAHESWAWYEEDGQAWQDAPTRQHMAFSLPTWNNLTLFGDCRKQIALDPPLAEWCPDLNHPHGGRLHPLIRREEATLPPYVFARKMAAIPTGVQYQVYPQAAERPSLVRAPTVEEMSAPVLASAGGVDYGSEHPSAIVVVQILPDVRDAQVSFVGPKGIAWVRECWFNDSRDSGDYDALNRARKALAERYNVWRWVTDPNEVYMAKSWQGEQTSASELRRRARINLVRTRLNIGKLFFDLSGPGVLGLFEEMKRVHFRKTRSGELVIVRLRDDRTAALEDAIEGLDGKPRIGKPAFTGKRGYPPPRKHTQMVHM